MGIIHHGLHLNSLRPSKPQLITTYSDVDWGSDTYNKKSKSGSCMYLRSNLNSRCSKKKTLVARSNNEVEYKNFGQ